MHIITADTFGSAAKACQGMKVNFIKLTQENGAYEKEKAVINLGADTTVAVGNGYNDHLMLKKAGLGIAVIEGEGAASKTIINADIVVKNINSALDLVLNPKAITATLRR